MRQRTGGRARQDAHRDARAHGRVWRAAGLAQRGRRAEARVDRERLGGHVARAEGLHADDRVGHAFAPPLCITKSAQEKSAGLGSGYGRGFSLEDGIKMGVHSCVCSRQCPV